MALDDILIGLVVDTTSIKEAEDDIKSWVSFIREAVDQAVADFNRFEAQAESLNTTTEALLGISQETADSYRRFNEATTALETSISRLRIQAVRPLVDDLATARIALANLEGQFQNFLSGDPASQQVSGRSIEALVRLLPGLGVADSLGVLPDLGQIELVKSQTQLDAEREARLLARQDILSQFNSDVASIESRVAVQQQRTLERQERRSAVQNQLQAIDDQTFGELQALDRRTFNRQQSLIAANSLNVPTAVLEQQMRQREMQFELQQESREARRSIQQDAREEKEAIRKTAQNTELQIGVLNRIADATEALAQRRDEQLSQVNSVE